MSIITTSKNENGISSKPNFFTTGIILITTNNTTPIKITINSSGLGENISENELEYYYVTSNNSDLQNLSTEQENKIPSNWQIEMAPDKPFLFIRAKKKSDNLVSSEWNYVEVPVNFKPFCSFFYDVTDNDKILSIDGNKIYTNYLRNISKTLYVDELHFQEDSRVITSHVWKIGTVNSLIERTSLKINELELSPIEFNYNDDQRIIIYLIIKDEYGDTFSYFESINYYRLKLQNPLNFEVFPQNENITVSPSFLSDQIKFKVKLSQLLDEPQYSLLFYKGVKDNGTWKYEENFIKNYPAINGTSTYENCDSGMIDNKDYKFKAILAVSLPSKNIVLGSIESKKPYRLLEAFNVENFAFSKEDWHPIKNYVDNIILGEGNKEDEVVLFTSTCYDNPGNTGINYYKIEALFNNNRVVLVDKIGAATPAQGWSVKVEGDTIYFKTKNLKLFKKLNVSSNIPTFSINYEITCYNAFGRTGKTLTYKGRIITQERPSINESDLNFKINSNASIQYLNWINPGDKITFTINAPPFDYNDYLLVAPDQSDTRYMQTVTNYEIYYRYQENEDWTQLLQKGSFDYSSYFITEGLLTNKGERLQDSLKNYLVFKTTKENMALSFTTIPVPNLNKNIEGTKIEFGIRFIDNTGLASEIISKNFFICRKTKPIFNIPHVAINSKKDGNGNNIKELTVYLQSIDLGGNNKGTENFRRSGKEKYEVLIEFNEENNNFNQSKKFTESNSNLIYSNETSNFLTTKTFELAEDWSKVYIRATIKIIANSETGDYIQTTTTSFLLYLNEPTLSYRSHWLGINTAENNQEDVFHISSFEERKNIRLAGFYEKGNVVKDIIVNIDLNTGKITSSENIEIDFFSGILTKQSDTETMIIDLTNGKILNAALDNTEISDSKISNVELDNTEINGGSW